MLPLGFLVVPMFFAKEAFSSDADNTFRKPENANDDDSSTAGMSLASSSVSSCSSDLDLSSLSIEESIVDEASQAILCSLLGPSVPKDNQSSTRSTISNSLPPNLRDSIAIDLPVGFFRLRRSMLSSDSKFWTGSVLQGALDYTEVSTAGWEHTHHHVIGSPDFPDHLMHSDVIGAKKETSYRMPAGRLVGASTAYETATISAYESEFFALSISTSTPGVPFGSRFLARTQIVVINTGENTCKLVCSVEAEFPKGAPMGMKGQIQKGMKKGTMETFEKIGSYIKNCAVSYGWC